MAIPDNTRVARFDSMADFLATMPKNAPSGTTSNASWTGGESYSDSLRLCSQGWPHVVADAEKLLSEFETGGLITRGRPTYVTDVAGAFPNVPAFLSGAPECMFRRGTIETTSDLAPLSIYLDVCCSSAVKDYQVKARGIAILALVLALNDKRPIDLFVYSAMGTKNQGACIPVIRIETRPLDISTATYALASAGFMRNMTFGWGKNGNGFDGFWAWHDYPYNATFQQNVRDSLEVAPQDLVIYGGNIYDPHLKDPVAWVKAQLALHSPQE